MKYFQICLADGNTGEVIYTTKSSAIGSSSYLRSKLMKNLDSFCNYLRDNSDRDVVMQISVREQITPLNIPFVDVY